MEFEEMKKIWDTQNNRPLYAIDEKALHQRIRLKRKGTLNFTRVTEFILIGSNTLAGGFILITNYAAGSKGIFSTLLGWIMIATALWLIIARKVHLQKEKQFDQTILGDINLAIASVSYRVMLSVMMQIYFGVVTGLVIASSLEAGMDTGNVLIIAGAAGVTFYLTRLEHKHWHVAKKKELERIRTKLTTEFNLEAVS